MKSMLMHSFVLDALETTGADTFSHFEVLVDEHRRLEAEKSTRPSRLKTLVPTVGTFHTHLPLRQAFEVYNSKHCLTKRKHIQVSFNEIRHIMNLAQVMAMRKPSTDEEIEKKESLYVDTLAHTSARNLSDDDLREENINPGQLNGPKLITFDGDQTLYSDGSNFESNPKLAHYLCMLLRHGVTVAVVTTAGYEYNAEKYEFRLSGLLDYFKANELSEEECHRFFLFGGECNYLLNVRSLLDSWCRLLRQLTFRRASKLGSDYRLRAVKETGPGGWITSTKYLPETPGNWSEEEISNLLDVAEAAVTTCLKDLNMRGSVIRKRRAVGLVPNPGQLITREALDETVLRCQSDLAKMNNGLGPDLPFCAFNGGKDCWVDVGNKRVGVQILESYLGIQPAETLHIGDQFLNTGNDYAARGVCPCIWITSPDETTYILKTILRLAGLSIALPPNESEKRDSVLDFSEVERRTKSVKQMDVYTGELKE